MADEAGLVTSLRARLAASAFHTWAGMEVVDFGAFEVIAWELLPEPELEA